MDHQRQDFILTDIGYESTRLVGGGGPTVTILLHICHLIFPLYCHYWQNCALVGLHLYIYIQNFAKLFFVTINNIVLS